MRNQTRLPFEEQKERKLMFTVWQPETRKMPWAVHCEGYRKGKVSVTVYHESIKGKGHATFPNLSLQTPYEFCDFATSMLKVYAQFSPDTVEVRPVDVKALLEGYRKGVAVAQGLYDKDSIRITERKEF